MHSGYISEQRSMLAGQENDSGSMNQELDTRNCTIITQEKERKTNYNEKCINVTLLRQAFNFFLISSFACLLLNLI